MTLTQEKILNKNAPEIENFAVIVLAAGQSSRLGKMKQLLPINGKVLIVRQLEKALAISNNVYCVLGHQAEQVQTCIEHLPNKTIINSSWSSGMASSIAAGVNALSANIEAVMIVLVDQWQLASEDLAQQKNCWQTQANLIVAAKNSNKEGSMSIGPPVVFPCKYFTELSQLTGEQGAKALLMKYRDNLLAVPMENAFIDVDTPEQLANMNKFLSEH